MVYDPAVWGGPTLLRHWQIIVRRDEDLIALGEPWSFCEDHIDRASLAIAGHDFMLLWVTLIPFPDDDDERHHINWGYIGGMSPLDLIERRAGEMAGSEHVIEFLRDPAAAANS